MPNVATISYEGRPGGDDVSVVRDAYHVRVTIPPLPTWRLLSRGIIVAVVVLGMIVVAWFSALLGMLLRGPFRPQMMGVISSC